MRKFLKKILRYLWMLKTKYKAWPRATPSSVPVTRDILEPSEEPAPAVPGPGGLRKRNRHAGIGGRRYHSRPVPDGKWVMRYHRGR